jgi:hypothetical protein
MADFKGAWIPRDLLSHRNLSANEKLLLGYAMSFNGKCFASDRHLAERLGLTPKGVANLLSGLRRKGILRGRDFPNEGTPILQNFPNEGTQTSLTREHRTKREQSTREQSTDFPEIRVEPGLGGPCSRAHETNEPIEAMKDHNPHDTVAAPPPAPRPPIDVNALYDSIFIDPAKKAREEGLRELAALKAQMKPQLDAMRRAAEDAYADELAAQREKEREEDAAAEREERERGDYY